MNTLVIGGGMAGLTYAIVAAKCGHAVTLAERNSRVGKKISLTGNGRCNIGHVQVSAKCYNNSAVVRRVLHAIPVTEYVRYLNSCGIYTYADREGRMYPLSDSAANVVDCLRYQLSKYRVRLLTDTVVTRIERANGGYDVNIGGRTEHFDRVVLACGGRSHAEEVNTSSLAPASALTYMCPSLVPVKVQAMDPTLNGLRAQATVSLYDGEDLLGSETGEVQFKEYGLSGICILDLSAIIARRQVQRKSGDYRFVLDVVPAMDEWTLEEVVYRRLASGERDKSFYGILHNKLGEHILRRLGSQASSSQIAHTAKHLPFTFDKLLDWSLSQVTAGGISEHALSDRLQLDNGVIALGEALDVDGICGGYNLYFAAASALYTFSPEEREKAYSC